jgi:hypothetical protein
VTLFQPMLVTGGTHPANSVRQMIRSLAQDNEGIVRGGDLKVSQISTPTGQVQVGDGSAFIQGRTAVGQGTYHVTNIGAATVNIAPTGASPRTDLIVLRVEDPEYEGTLNPGTQTVAYFTVVSGVSSTATTIPNSAWSAIVLARVTIPANTAAITDAMITSLRTLANPRRDRKLYIANHPATNHDLTHASYNLWPNSSEHSLVVPSWATSVRIVGQVTGVKLLNSSMTGGIRVTIDGSIVGQGIGLDYDAPSGTYRTHLATADTIAVPEVYKGTSRTLRIQAYRATGTGILRADAGTASILDVEFTETPV